MNLYLSHFGLHEAPFGLTPDTGFLFAHPAHREALTTLQLALAEGEGFVKITGEVGTGKTLLCRALLERLQAEGCPVAYLPNPVVTPRQALRTLCQELALNVSERAAAGELQSRLERHLIERAQAGQRTVLLIDDAQAMPVATLETLRLMSNVESSKHKLLQVVLVGQPELDGVLATSACRSLASRIGFSSRLHGLSRDDFGRYLQHRLIVAGWKGEPVFSAIAIGLLHRASAGVPRRANVMANKALMLAFGRGKHRVGIREAWLAWRDSQLPRSPAVPTELALRQPNAMSAGS